MFDLIRDAFVRLKREPLFPLPWREGIKGRGKNTPLPTSPTRGEEYKGIR